MTADRLLFTRRQVAAMLGVRRADVSAWVVAKRLRTVDVDGRERIPRSELDRIEREGLPKADAPKPKPSKRGTPKADADAIRSIEV